MSRKITSWVSPELSTGVRHCLEVSQEDAGRSSEAKALPCYYRCSLKTATKGQDLLIFHVAGTVLKKNLKITAAEYCCGYLKDAFPSLSSGFANE